MNKAAFEAGLAALQAQIDAADRALVDARAALDAAKTTYSVASNFIKVIPVPKLSAGLN